MEVRCHRPPRGDTGAEPHGQTQRLSHQPADRAAFGRGREFTRQPGLRLYREAVAHYDRTRTSNVADFRPFSGRWRHASFSGVDRGLKRGHFRGQKRATSSQHLSPQDDNCKPR